MRGFRLCVLTLLALGALPGRVPAQGVQSGSAERAAGGTAVGAATITPNVIRHHVFVIADDSMGGRDTPSRGLELTAAYVADRFRAAGLQPAGDSGSFLQRYPLRESVASDVASRVEVTAGGERVSLTFERDVVYVDGPRSGEPVRGEVVLLGGALTAEAIERAALAGKVAVLVVDFARAVDPQMDATDLVFAADPAAIVLLSNRDENDFAARVKRQHDEGVPAAPAPPEGPVMVEVHDRALGTLLASAGVDLAAVRGDSLPVLRQLPQVSVTPTVGEPVRGTSTAPNVVGIVEGTDPVLKHQYVVFSAHMDHVGTTPGATPDSIWNGADDDASGTAGVIALAEAFARAPPRRSVILLTVSGEEKGLWGSAWFAEHPPVPLDSIVADLNMDMIGRNWRDTIAVIGREHSDLGETLARVNGDHPELGLAAIGDIWPHESFYYRSDHYNFARRGVPILFFFNGTHEDYHGADDSPAKIDAEKTARIVTLVYYVGQEVANRDERPRWDGRAHREIVR
jgi:hypothetical protein